MSSSEGSQRPDDPSQLTTPLQGRTLRFVLALAVFGLGVAAVAYAWRTWGVHATREPQYLVAVDKIVTTPTPAWIHADLVQQVVRDGSLANQSMLDPQLTIKVADAFRLHPWVRSVRRVSKRSSAVIEVDLEFRRPVALVEVITPDARGVLPVDGDGVLLPREDFVNKQGQLIDDALRYPVIVAGDSLPEGPAGSPWGDPIVAGGARLAAALNEIWGQCGLLKIVPSPPNVGPSETRREFLLLAGNGSRVLWGEPPGNKPKDQRLTKEKIERLVQYVENNQPFDSNRKAVEIDLREGQEPQTAPYTAQAAEQAVDDGQPK